MQPQWSFVVLCAYATLSRWFYLCSSSFYILSGLNAQGKNTASTPNFEARSETGNKQKRRSLKHYKMFNTKILNVPTINKFKPIRYSPNKSNTSQTIPYKELQPVYQSRHQDRRPESMLWETYGIPGHHTPQPTTTVNGHPKKYTNFFYFWLYSEVLRPIKPLNKKLFSVTQITSVEYAKMQY